MKYVLRLCAVLTAGFLTSSVEAKVRKGDKAPMFKSIDENHQPVDMKDLINGKPLVLAVGSAS